MSDETRQPTGLARMDTHGQARVEPITWEVFLSGGSVPVGTVRVRRGVGQDRLVAIPEMGMVTQHATLEEAANAVAEAYWKRSRR